MRAGFGAGLTRGNLEQHELGHVIGLDHVQDRGQVMYPSISDQSPDGYGPGDRAGLSILGRQSGCLNAASPTDSFSSQQAGAASAPAAVETQIQTFHCVLHD